MTTPSRARLIHLLIEERAKTIHSRARYGMPWSLKHEEPTDEQRSQARREIEHDVLKGGS